jgi:hypothetical protein
MAENRFDRRNFLSTGARTGVALCGLCACGGVPGFLWAGEGTEGEKIDPKVRNFCGYICPEDCKFLNGTLNDDVELKKQAWKVWKIEERFDLEFDEAQAICYGCKELDKPQGVVVSRCDVRACAQEKQHDCCIECEELTACDKDLWRRFPDFKKQVIEMQVKYQAQA